MSLFTSLMSISLGAILVNNFILAQFLGICPFMGVSQKTGTAMGMGLAVTFVMGIASAVTWAVNTYILVPLDLQYMQTVAFILVIAALVQFVEMFLQKAVPALYQALGIYLPLITTNCAVLGVVLLNTQNSLRHHRRHRLPGGHRAVRLHPGAHRGRRLPQELQGLSHCPDLRGSAGAGLHGLLRHEDLRLRRA